MARKPKIEIKMVCEKCGKSPEIDKEKSNENWKIYSTTCECGGKIKTTFE